MSDLTNDEQAIWISLHIYPQGDLDDVVCSLVQPALRELSDIVAPRGFFFLRDGTDGSHVRFRVAVRPADAEAAERWMVGKARSFLDDISSEGEQAPSTGTPSSPSESPRWVLDAFEPEVFRYGGEDLIDLSLHLFALSSLALAPAVCDLRAQPHSARLSFGTSLILEQALAFAQDPTELLDLVRYGVDTWGEAMPTIISKGRDGSKRAVASLAKLMQTTIESLGTPFNLSNRALHPLTPRESLMLGTAILSSRLLAEDRATRARIGGSHLHMHSSRLGLSNVEEVYLSAILSSALPEIQSSLSSRIDTRAVHLESSCSTAQADSSLSSLVRVGLLRHSHHPFVDQTFR